MVIAAGACTLPWTDSGKIACEKTSTFAEEFLAKDGPRIAADINDNIASTPPFRLVHYRLQSGTFLTLSIHHSIFDGQSLEALLRDAEAVYLKQPLPETVSLSGAVNRVLSLDIEAAERFWRQKLEGFGWPTFRELSTVGTQTESLVVTLDASLESLFARATKARVTFNALCTAAFALCLARYFYGSDDVVFGVRSFSLSLFCVV